MKRVGIGLVVVVLVVLVFSIEGILTLFRQRNINVTIELQNGQGIIATEEATSEATDPASKGTSNSTGIVLPLPPDGAVIVHAKWDYQIGPRFPATTISAQALDQTGKVVASAEYTFNCGSASISCTGDYPLTLAYGVLGDEGTRTNWPTGNYTIQVTRRYSDFKAQPVTNPYTIKVE